MSEQRFSPEIEASLRDLAAMSDDDIDCSDIPEVTDFSGFRDRKGRWLQPDRRFVMDVGEDVAGWFGQNAPLGEDWHEGAKRALEEFIAQAERRAA